MGTDTVKNNDRKLIIVESPTKARTITRFLGPDCTIIASNGHIRTLPKDSLCIDIKNGYKPEYIEDASKSKVISTLKTELKKADELILATDEDREGESISWHLLEVLKPKVPYRRMVFHEITKKAILEAFKNGRDLDMNLVHAQEARRVLDRLYGYKISPVLWSKLSNKNLSAGRVQSPGLRLIVDREKVRLVYKKGSYYDVEVSFDKHFKGRLDTFNGQKIATGRDFDSETGKYTGSSKTLLLTEEIAANVVEKLQGCVYTVEEIKEKKVIQRPQPPFTTSTLQQDGNRRLHLSAKDVMRISQNLYENGLITYMRTDSTALSAEGIQAAKRAAEELCGREYVSASDRHYQTKTVNAQEAHEAIRPAGEVFRRPEETGLSGKDLALYTLIYNRTLATQMKDAVKFTTTVVLSGKNPGKGGGDAVNATLVASGTRIDFAGFLRLYAENSASQDEREDDAQSGSEDALREGGDSSKEVILPRLESGETVNVLDIQSKHHETKAPARFTEASLVQELEKRGIGRPSTYAAIIDRILEKKYVVREGSALVPTFTAFGVVDLLENYFNNRIDYDFTSQMEEDLDKISNGELEEEKYLESFYKGSGNNQGLEEQIKEVKDLIDSKKAKRLVIPGLKEENYIMLGPYGPYVQNNEGKFVSVPESLTPSSVTDEIIENLKNSASSGSSSPKLLGVSSTGRNILYCTGRYGDYWQLGDISQKDEVKRFKVPAEYKGREVPLNDIERLFSLPFVVGKTETGEDIKAGYGRYGAYLQCGDDFRHVKTCEELLNMSEEEARAVFSEEKKTAKGASKKSAGSAKRTASAKKALTETEKNEESASFDAIGESVSSANSSARGSVRKTASAKKASEKKSGEVKSRASSVIKDFGEVEGKPLFITSGRYGFYLKYGTDNIRIAAKYQHDEASCKEMTLEEALGYLK